MLVSLSYLWLPSLLSRCERAFDIFTVVGRRAFGRFWHGQRRGFAHRLHLPKYVFSDMLPPTSGSCNCHGKVKCIFKSVTLGKPRILKILYELNFYFGDPMKWGRICLHNWFSQFLASRNIQWIACEKCTNLSLTKMLLTCKMSRILTGYVWGLRTMPHFSSVAGAKLLAGKKPDKQLRVRTCGHFAMRKEGVCGEPSPPISFSFRLCFIFQSDRFVFDLCSTLNIYFHTLLMSTGHRTFSNVHETSLNVGFKCQCVRSVQNSRSNC